MINLFFQSISSAISTSSTLRRATPLTSNAAHIFLQIIPNLRHIVGHKAFSPPVLLKTSLNIDAAEGAILNNCKITRGEHGGSGSQLGSVLLARKKKKK